MNASRDIWTHLREVALDKQAVLLSSWTMGVMTLGSRAQE